MHSFKVSFTTLIYLHVFLMIRRPPCRTRTVTRFPYTTRVRSSAPAPSAAGHRPEQLQGLVEPFPAKLPVPGLLLHPGTSPSPDKAIVAALGDEVGRAHV